jgi:phosphatidyl-myo-inositol alpha-mannosyltransferase
MRLAMLSYRLPAPGLKRGGIERAAHVLAEGLARRGHEVVVFSHDPRPSGASYEVRELPWKRFVNTWLGQRMTMGYLGNLVALMPDYREFNAIIAHGDSLLLPLSGRPIVRIMHGSARGEARSARSAGRWILQMGVYLQELATALIEDGTVAVSECARRDNRFVRRVIPHGVDRGIFFPSPADKTREPSVLFVGTLEGRKRGRLLVDIFERIVRVSYPDASLAMVGPSGPVMPGVTYHTGVSDIELGGLYRRAWVYASPSTYEGFGLPYLEAMASGTAVLATPNPGSREVLLDGRYGQLAGDETFSGALVALLGDAQARRVFEGQGLQRAQEYSLDAMLDRYEALLMELCAGHARRIASV